MATASITYYRAFANVAAAQTDSNVVTAVAEPASAHAGKRIRVHAVWTVAGAVATTLTFNSKGAGAGTAISALFAQGVNGGAVAPLNPAGWFETNSGEALTVTTGAGSATGIQITYSLN
jgi:hypothetical protein